MIIRIRRPTININYKHIETTQLETDTHLPYEILHLEPTATMIDHMMTDYLSNNIKTANYTLVHRSYT